MHCGTCALGGGFGLPCWSLLWVGILPVGVSHTNERKALSTCKPPPPLALPFRSQVYCLNASTGAAVWSAKTGGQLTSSPVLTPGGAVVVGSADFRVYALDGLTGGPNRVQVGRRLHPRSRCSCL